MRNLFVLIFALIMFVSVDGKVFEMCELARTLKSKGMGSLSDWVCLVKHESAYNTRSKGGPNRNGSYDYGIFQINDRYWCKVGYPGGDCRMDCNKFLDDDISDDILCAKLIFKRQGFKAWYGWQKGCRGKPLPDVNHCFRVAFYYAFNVYL